MSEALPSSSRRPALLAAVAFFVGAFLGPLIATLTEQAATGWPVMLAAFVAFFPTSLALGYASPRTSWLSALSTLAGVFLGVCFTLLVFLPGSANLFPIAAAIWTGIAFLPSAAGFVGGTVLRLIMERARRA